jgi:Tfp pilus assembly protein PilF
MTIAYPNEGVNWEIPSLSVRTIYTGAIDSARSGVYDSSTGNTDFLSNVLPSLALLTLSQQTRYFFQAETDLSAALKTRPNSVLANYLFGTLRQKEGNPEGAIPFLEKAVSLEPGCLQTGYALVSAYFAQKDFAKAEQTAAVLLERYPKDTRLLKICAEINYAQGKYEAAAVYADRILKTEPWNLTYLLFRARLSIREGNYIRAISLLDVYARSDQQSRDYLLLRGQIQHEWNKNDEDAVGFIEQALTLYPEDNAVILAAAELAGATGQPIHGQTAQDLAARILRQDLENRRAKSILLSQSIVKRQWEDAYQYSAELLAVDSPTPGSQATHVDICLHIARFGEARQYADRLFQEYPARDEAIQAYIKILTATQDPQALALIQEYLPNARAGMRSFLYCQQSLLRTRDTDILEDLRKSLMANPRNQDALFQFYRFYFVRGDYRKASYYLKQIVALNPRDEYMLGLDAELGGLIT